MSHGAFKKASKKRITLVKRTESLRMHIGNSKITCQVAANLDKESSVKSAAEADVLYDKIV